MSFYTNEGVATATYETINVRSESAAVVEIPAIVLKKTASPTLWIGDELTYTARIAHAEPQGTTASNIEFTDTIDITRAELLLDSVTINGVPATAGSEFIYSSLTGLLTVPLPDLNPGGEHVIIFRVSKILP